MTNNTSSHGCGQMRVPTYEEGQVNKGYYCWLTRQGGEIETKN